MKTKQITIKGVEYTVRSSTNLGLENAERDLKKSLKQVAKQNKDTEEDGISEK